MDKGSNIRSWENKKGRIFDEHLIFSSFQAYLSEYPSCNGTLDEPSGSLASPGYPGNYPKNAACAWTIRTKPGQRISLRLNHVRSDCGNDYIILGGLAPDGSIDGKKKAPRRMLICGEHAKRGLEYTSMTNTLTVFFRTNIHEAAGYFNMTYKGKIIYARPYNTSSLLSNTSTSTNFSWLWSYGFPHSTFHSILNGWIRSLSWGALKTERLTWNQQWVFVL
jgi:hypothetical protein